MTRVLLLSATTGYQIRSFDAAAAELGIELVIGSDRCHQLDDPWRDRAVPVRFHDAEAAMAVLEEAFLRARPDGVLAVGDRPVVLAAKAAGTWGLPGHPLVAARISRNKRLTREALRAAGLPTPAFRAVPRRAMPHGLASVIAYPAVVKPLALSGSRGVIRVDAPEGFVAAFERLSRLLDLPEVREERDEAHDDILIESFIPGREFALEGLLTRGGFKTLAVFEKPDPLDGPFFEETIYLTPPRVSPEQVQGIAGAAADAARAIGLRHGPIHAECRVNARGVYVLEVAARPIGGLCSKALRFVAPGSASTSFEALLLRHVRGDDVSAFEREPTPSGVLMIPIPRGGVLRGVSGVEAAASVPGIEEVRITAKPDARLVPLPEGHSYLGFVFARASTPAAVEAALRTAHGRLRFTIDRDIPLARPGACAS